MKETLRPARLSASSSKHQFEYLVLTFHPKESAPIAYQRIREHAEYGKWELERTRLYQGGSRKYWLKRRVLRVERTLEIF